MQLRTWGRCVLWLDVSIDDGDLRPLIALAMLEQTDAVAKEFNLGEGQMGETHL
jgi:hypothetical protein